MNQCFIDSGQLLNGHTIMKSEVVIAIDAESAKKIYSIGIYFPRHSNSLLFMTTVMISSINVLIECCQEKVVQCWFFSLFSLHWTFLKQKFWKLPLVLTFFPHFTNSLFYVKSSIGHLVSAKGKLITVHFSLNWFFGAKTVQMSHFRSSFFGWSSIFSSSSSWISSVKVQIGKC